MINLCTLFDSNYLDRGIVLYQSLVRHAKDFCLYVLCMDEVAFQTLKNMNLKDMVVISETQVLDDDLAKIKAVRKRAEYCWTCTPVIVQYVLDQYEVSHCTYIDADMMFYDDPEILLKEIVEEGASIGIIGHRFPRNIARRKRERFYGKYCVEFNTFMNDDRGRNVLADWKKNCFQKCTMEYGEGSFGDQKYLEEWEKKFEGVYECQHLGAGVAPWNISDYRPSELGEEVQLVYRKKQKCNLIFYHFQSLMILKDGQAFVGVYNELGIKSHELIRFLYWDYLEKLIEARKLLKKSDVVIPLQELRSGEKSAISKMSFKDLIIFCYQCVPCIIDGKKNYWDIVELMGEKNAE